VRDRLLSECSSLRFLKAWEGRGVGEGRKEGRKEEKERE